MALVAEQLDAEAQVLDPTAMFVGDDMEGEEQTANEESSREMVEELGGFFLREAPADRFFGNFLCRLGA